MNTQGGLGRHPGKVIPTTVSESACGLCSQLEPDAVDHWRALSSGPRYDGQGGVWSVPPAPAAFGYASTSKSEQS